MLRRCGDLRASVPGREDRVDTTSAAGDTILVVCQANETRSPLYAAALAAALARRGAPWIVGSAGTLAAEARPARADVRRVAFDLGLYLDHHRSRRLTAELATAAGLIVTAERAHRDHVAQLVPDVAARTFTAGELAELLERAWGGRGRGSPAEVAAVAHDARPRWPAAGEDLADPTGRGADAHRELGVAVRRLVEPVADALGGPDPGTGRRSPSTG